MSIATANQSAKPILKSLQAKIIGPITMTTAWSGRCEIAFGTPSTPGITIEAHVEFVNHEISEGTLEFVQLVETCRERRNATGVNKRFKSNGYVLDTIDPYDSLPVNQTGGTIKLQTTDSPGNPVGNNIYISITDSFQIWLLWKAKGQPRMALGMLEWNWEAEAEKTSHTGDCNADWRVLKNLAFVQIGSKTTILPKWSDNIINFSFELGSCKRLLS